MTRPEDRPLSYHIPNHLTLFAAELASPLVLRAITRAETRANSYRVARSLLGGAALCKTFRGVDQPELWFKAGETRAFLSSIQAGQYDERIGPGVPDYLVLPIGDTKLVNAIVPAKRCTTYTTVAAFREFVGDVKRGTYETLEPGICPPNEIPLIRFTDDGYRNLPAFPPS